MNILVTTFWSFKDALIQTYTLPYLKIMRKHLPVGSRIYLLTIEQPKFEIPTHEIAQIDADLAQYNIVAIRFPYFNYGIKSLLNWGRILIQLLFLIISKNITIIHSFCTPAGLSGYILAVLTRRTFIIDSYEPHAEASVENGDWQRDSFRFKLLFTMEKLMSKRANYIISATEGMRKYAQEKYQATFKHFFVKPACVDLQQFSPSHRKKKEIVAQLGFEGKIVAVYAGKFGGIYLEKETFDFFKVAYNFWGDKFRILILTNHSREQIENFANNSNVPIDIIQQKFVKHSEIADYMGVADFGITPVKPIPTKRYCTPIKDGEYWALGLPIVITKNISDDSEIVAANDIGAVINEFTPQEYLRCVKVIDNLLTTHKPEELYAKVRGVAEKYRSYEIAEQVYASVYERLLKV